MQTSASAYPASLGVSYPERSSRLLALLLILVFIKLVLAIPHLIVLAVYNFVAAIIGWIAQWVVLFTGKYPAGLFDFVLGNLQWSWRVTAWIVGLTDRYPPFGGETVASYPASATCERPETSHRGLAIVRIIYLTGILLIPHLLALAGLGLILISVFLVAPWAVLFSGNFPKLFVDLLVGVSRWQHRVNCYMSGLTDRYPPFRLSS